MNGLKIKDLWKLLDELSIKPAYTHKSIVYRDRQGVYHGAASKCIATETGQYTKKYLALKDVRIETPCSKRGCYSIVKLYPDLSAELSILQSLGKIVQDSRRLLDSNQISISKYSGTESFITNFAKSKATLEPKDGSTLLVIEAFENELKKDVEQVKQIVGSSQYSLQMESKMLEYISNSEYSPLSVLRNSIGLKKNDQSLNMSNYLSVLGDLDSKVPVTLAQFSEQSFSIFKERAGEDIRKKLVEAWREDVRTTTEMLSNRQIDFLHEVKNNPAHYFVDLKRSVEQYRDAILEYIVISKDWRGRVVYLNHLEAMYLSIKYRFEIEVCSVLSNHRELAEMASILIAEQESGGLTEALAKARRLLS